MHNPQPKNFTWLFLATYADAKLLPIVLRTQANTEDEARSQLSGDFSLTFAAKIRSDCPLTCHWVDRDSSVLWSVMGCNADASIQQMKGAAMSKLEILTLKKAKSRTLQLSTLLMVISENAVQEHERQSLVELAYDISCELASFILEQELPEVGHA
ncbi:MULTISPECIES: host cell division inhibitor Icd-like protein [Klebsiella/Raoultella group]